MCQLWCVMTAVLILPPVFGISLLSILNVGRAMFRLLMVTVFFSLSMAASAGIVDDLDERRRDADQAFSSMDYIAAHAQYAKLAKSGDKFAQYRLAMLYYFGLGVAKDPILAAVWTGVAQEPGLPVLQRMYQLLAKELSVAQRLEMKQRLADFDVSYGVTVYQRPSHLFPRFRVHDLVGHVWSPGDLKEFKERYEERIREEFNQLDRVAME